MANEIINENIKNSFDRMSQYEILQTMKDIFLQVRSNLTDKQEMGNFIEWLIVELDYTGIADLEEELDELKSENKKEINELRSENEKLRDKIVNFKLEIYQEASEITNILEKY